MRTNEYRIMIVDDDPSIVEFLSLGLRNEGYQVETAMDGVSGINLAKSFQPHVAILDVMMPGMDGFEVTKMLTKQGQIAVILLTAKDAVESRVHGLTLGADDYMIKPFSFDELLARIQARIRNQFPHTLNEQVIGPFVINDPRHEIQYQGEQLALSATEYQLLRYLAINHGIVLSKAKILEQIWGYDFGGQENIVEVYIRALREKLHDANHDIIRTIRGAGYRMDVS